MRPNLFWMIAASLLCVALIFMSRTYLFQAPALLEVELSSLNSVVTYAFVFFATLLPVVCIISLIRGWLSFSNEEQRPRALGRLVAWPILAAAITASLFGLGLVITI